MSTRLLIDSDILVYRAGFATDKTKYLLESPGGARSPIDDFATAKRLAATDEGSVIWSRKATEPEDKALLLIDVMIGEIHARYSEQRPIVVCFLTGMGNYRNSIATRLPYKGNRDQPKPAHFKAIRNYLLTKWGAVLSAGEEADDLIGIEATTDKDCIICSIDKDLKQLPGRHFNFVTKEESTVSVKEASLNFFMQCLTGDATDNIPGVAGIGPVKAKNILDGAKSVSDCWKRILDVYQEQYKEFGEAYAIECARLVHLRRTVGQIWEPPTL